MKPTCLRSLTAHCSEFGTEKPLQIVKPFQGFWLFGAFQGSFFPVLIKHIIYHVFRELGFIKTCLFLL